MKKTFFTGLVVVLPSVILLAAFIWMFGLLRSWLRPLTDPILAGSQMPELLAILIVVVLMFFACVFIGYLVRTRLGSWMHDRFDQYLQKLAPGYRMVKEVVAQFFGDASKSPFANGEVALVKIFGAATETRVTAIVTSKHGNGDYTVFVPTGPNPTSGNMYHVTAEQVELRPDVGVENMMRSIIACGAGSGALFAGKPEIVVK